MKIDDATITILRHLRDGRKSFKTIADDMSITENTVRARVARMKSEGLLDIVGLVDTEDLPGHRVIFVGIKLKDMNLVENGKRFAELKGVISVAVVTGRFDLIIQVLLKEDFGLLEFYTDEVSRLEGVQSVETFVVYKGYNLRVPYVL